MKTLLAITLPILICLPLSAQPRESGSCDSTVLGVDWIIVGIHGLQPKPEIQALAYQWHRALIAGLKTHENVENPEVVFEMVRWVGEPTPSVDSCSIAENSLSRTIHLSLTTEAADRSDSIRDLINHHYPESEEVFEKPLAWLAEQLPWASLQEDLKRYYESDAERSRIRQRLKSVLCRYQNSDIVLIAHSMGSLIAYDVLMENPQIKVDYFITIGSPLGTTPIREVLRKEWGKDDQGRFLVPAGVQRGWANLADRFDPVAADSSLESSFKKNDHGVEVEDQNQVFAWSPRSTESEPNPRKSWSAGLYAMSNEVKRSLDHVWLVRHHSVCGYLQTPEMARIITRYTSRGDGSYDP